MLPVISVAVLAPPSLALCGDAARRGGVQPRGHARCGGRVPSGWLLASLALLFLCGASAARSQSSREYELKAAMTYKFFKYLEWPSDRFEAEDSPVVIGIYGSDPFGETIDRAFEGRRYGERSFVLNRYKALGGIRACHLLFVSAKEAEHLPRILDAVSGKSVLIVGESEGFAASGGIINFYVRRGKVVHFEINPGAAKRERIRISSNLLKLARIVKDEEGGE